MSTIFPPADYIQVKSQLDGIEVYAPAPKETKTQPEVLTFTCPNCGATTAYSAAGEALACSHCGYVQPVEAQIVGRQAPENEFTVETMQQAAHGWGVARKEVECQNCGAIASVPPESLAHTCPFCGSNKVIQRQEAADVLRPRFVIPFKIEAGACRDLARSWLGSSWMTPNTLQSVANLAVFTGIYLPFWTFEAGTHAKWKAEVGHTETERYYDNGQWRERARTVWRWESGQVSLQISDLLVAGTTRLSQRLLDSMKNYDLGALRPYDPQFLAGFQAQAYDLPLEKAWEVGRQRMRDQTRLACEDQASTHQIRNFSMSLDFADEGWRYLLLPVYLTAYSYENKTYQVMINGQTGSIAGQRPVDWNKVWLAIAVLLAPGLLLSLLGLVTLPLAGIGVAVGGFGFVLLLIGLVIGIIFLFQAYNLDKA